MAIEFRMPSLGPDMESGTLVEWRMKPGDAVKRGDVVALVETDKGIIDVEIFNDGVVEKLLVEKGAHVPVGGVLAILSGDAPGAAKIETPKPVAEPKPAQVERAIATSAPRTRISPAAKLRAHAAGLDISSLTGTGPGGVITLQDVEARVPKVTPPPAARPPDMRQIIAKAMARSKREIPHYYLTSMCNFSAARSWLDRHNAGVQIEARILPATLFVKAVALAARSLPDFNGWYEEGFSPADKVNVGLAIAMRGGRLVAPAIMEADTKSLTTIMSDLRDLTARVRAGHMRNTELTQGTITVTSLAEDGPDTILPIIQPPQVAMIGFGTVAPRPIIVDGAVQAALTVAVTLAADHRVTDGRGGARFIATVRDLLQDPERL